jgi:hypothetical protein
MFDRLKCRLGFHAWARTFVSFVGPDWWRCTRCPVWDCEAS